MITQSHLRNIETSLTMIHKTHNILSVKYITALSCFFTFIILASIFGFSYFVSMSYNKSSVIVGISELQYGQYTTGEIITGIEKRLTSIRPINYTERSDNITFCLINFANQNELKERINQSIQKSVYKQFKIVNGRSSPKQKGYYDYLEIVRNECPNESFVMFLICELQPLALQAINQVAAKSKVELLYTVRGSMYEPLAFSKRAFEILQSTKKNKSILGSRIWVVQRQSQSLALLQIGVNYMQQIERAKVYKNENCHSFLWASKKSKSYYEWSHYKSI